jgi:hypothetical protein
MRKKIVMRKRILMKIRLRQDGTWENVYDDFESERNKLSEMASDYLDQAVEASGYRDAKQVIDYIRGLK